MKDDKKGAALILALGKAPKDKKEKEEEFEDPMGEEESDEYSEEKTEAAKDVAAAITAGDESAMATKLISLIDLCVRRGS